MENTIKEAFVNVKMSDACEAKILNSFQTRPGKPLWIRFAVAATVCLLTLTLLFTNPGIVQALGNALESVGKTISELFHHGVSPNKHYTVYVTEPAETETAPSGESSPSGGNYFVTVPQWLEVRDDGLYFRANGEEIEIGNLITEEIPFTYVYTDNGITYYIVVGGTYAADGTPFDGVGWALWRQDAKVAETDPTAAWQGGFAAGVYDTETGEGCVWYQEGKRILGVPYP